MGFFSRASPAAGKTPCVACCQADHGKDEQLSKAGLVRVAALTGSPGHPPPMGANSDCAQQARSLAPMGQRFDRSRQALPSARAAADLNKLGDKPGDVPSGMNTTNDAGRNIINSRFLRRELAGEGPGLNPIDIKVRNPAMRGVVDSNFEHDKQSYLAELDSMQTAFDTGGSVATFPPVRAASKETIVGEHDAGRPGSGRA